MNAVPMNHALGVDMNEPVYNFTKHLPNFLRVLPKEKYIRILKKSKYC